MPIDSYGDAKSEAKSEAKAPKLMDPTFHRGDPYPTYRELRAEMPLGRHPDGYWVVTKHADVIEISCDPAAFCNSRGTSRHSRRPCRRS